MRPPAGDYRVTVTELSGAMTLADDAQEEARRRECEALRALADVLRHNRSLWDRYAQATFSFQRFCDAVDQVQGRGTHLPSDGEDTETANSKVDVLLRMLERMNTLYDFLEDPRSNLQQAAALLPSRSTLPMDNAGLVAFCHAVYTRLLPVPGATTVRGGFASRMRNLNASLSIYAECKPEEVKEKAMNTLLSTHARLRDHCLHLLLVQVDAQIIRFAEHIAFQDAYHEERSSLMKVTVEARKAYFHRRFPWMGYDA